jgi:predicted nucleic acid-binding protein
MQRGKDVSLPPGASRYVFIPVGAPTLYLDTSVLGGYFDDEWKFPTQELWRQMEQGKYRFLTSSIAVDELAKAPDQVRELFTETFLPEAILDVTKEMECLASAYMSEAILTPKYSDDARHVAACTVAMIDYLVSWNFRHLVNVEREKDFNAVNLLQGYQSVRIVNPFQLIYGDDTQDL